MSDARTEAIHKAATELVQELLSAGAKEGGERWFHIIVRKMEGLPAMSAKGSLLRVGRFEFSRLGEKVVLQEIVRRPGYNQGGDRVYEADTWEPKDIAKLKLWLNGE